MKTAIVMNNIISIIVNFCVKHLFMQILKFNTIKGWNITGILLEIYWNRVFDFDNVVFLQKN